MPAVRMYRIVPLLGGVPALLRMHGVAATFRGVHKSPFFKVKSEAHAPLYVYLGCRLRSYKWKYTVSSTYGACIHIYIDAAEAKLVNVGLALARPNHFENRV